MKKIIITLSALFCLCLASGVSAEAGPSVVRYTLNGTETDVSVNPTTAKDLILTISIEADREVKLTRVYFCPENDSADCKNYVKYVSPNTVGTVVGAEWNGYQTGDSSAVPPGNYWLKVLLKEGDTASVSIVLNSHKVVIGEVIAAQENENDNNQNNSATSLQTTSSRGSGSTHSSQTDLSSAVTKSPSVGAGRNRLVAVDSAVSFEAWAENIDGVSGDYVWTFGDGSSSTGEKVSHSYQFAGIYNVVLNGEFGGKEAISRTTVEVFDPKISIMRVDISAGFVELQNTSTYETNLSDWSLGCDSHSFNFPKDTIISAESNLKLPLTLTKCVASSTSWTLLSGDKIFAQLDTKAGFGTIERDRQLVLIKEKIAYISAELEKRKAEVVGGAQYFDKGETEVEEEPAASSASAVAEIENSLDNAAAGVIILDQDPLPARQSILGRIKSWFGK